jgi:putative transposase
MYFHLILVVKYRKKVFDDEISEYARNKFIKISKKYNITLEEWNHDKDHIHILFRTHPNSEISKFINVYKSSSSRMIKKDFPKVKQKLWKEMFWSRSFCLITSGGATIETIKQYINSQGE